MQISMLLSETVRNDTKEIEKQAVFKNIHQYHSIHTISSQLFNSLPHLYPLPIPA
jgi:hypothetical protein